EVEPKHAYIQQPVTVTYTLFFRQDVRTFDVKSLSTTEGFWSENLKVPNPPQVINRMVNGREYRSAVIHKLLLYPTRHGELSIGPMDLTLEIQEKRKSRRSRSLFDNFFDDPFGTSRVQKQVSSKPKIVKVKPLPDLGRPAGFDGAVGEYKINARLDRDTVNTNESVTLKVTISGNGNIGFLPEQSISIPPDIERYDPEIKEHAEPLGGKLHGKKTFTYLLIPRRAGLQRITPIKFSFFDPVKGKYVTSSTNELLLQVNPVEGWTASGAVIPGGSPEEVQSLATDIRWIHDATQGLHRAEKPVYRRATYPLAYIIPLIFAVTALFARKRRNKFQSDTAARKSRMAAKHAYKALKEAKELQDAGKIDQGYTALARGLINYFSDRTGNVSSTVDRNRIDLVLQHRHVPENLRIKVASIIDKCNSARFTPDGLDNISLTRLIEESRTWIHNVNHYLE
ncbi:MAG: BatD family protein, partial [Candidatus Electryonea clarkiae]|nr:BatD family protein [Candidatus Electryonea clarkiae]